MLRECSIRSAGRLYWKVFYLCQRGFGQNLCQFCEEYLICSCPCTHNSKYALKHLGRNNPSQQHMLWTDQLNSSSAEKDVGVLVENWTWASNASLQQKSPASSGITLLRGQGRWFFPSTLLWWDTSGVPCSVLGSPTQGRYGLTGVSPARGHKDN